MRNDLTIYDTVADRWWSDDIRWVRTLEEPCAGAACLVRPADRLAGQGRAGSGLRRGLHGRGDGAARSAVSPASTRPPRRSTPPALMPAPVGLRIGYDVGVGEALPYDAASFRCRGLRRRAGTCDRPQQGAGRGRAHPAPRRAVPVRHDQPQPAGASGHHHHGRGPAAPVAARHA